MRSVRWLAIADSSAEAQSTWDEARVDLGLSVRQVRLSLRFPHVGTCVLYICVLTFLDLCEGGQALGVSTMKLLCWHWVQPFACETNLSTGSLSLCLC